MKRASGKAHTARQYYKNAGPNMANQKVKVASKQELDASIYDAVSNGFTVMHQTETSAIVVRKKEFSITIAIVGFFLCVVGLIAYAIYYSFQEDEVVEIEIT
ncbi:MAG: hypothetical protein HY300_13880 [Verrucomicrobia bacterium]|nr:hypothetical protein [Verrucomicrobiota bacterium]